MMTIEYIKNKVNELALEKWGVSFNLPVKIVKNLNAYGRFSARIDAEERIIPCEMELAYELIKFYPQEIIEGVILHELCHWALLLQGKPNGDADIEFFIEMQKVGGLFPHQIPKIGYYHVAKCGCCGKVIGTEDTKARCKSRMKGLISICCNEDLKYGGIQYVNTYVSG